MALKLITVLALFLLVQVNSSKEYLAQTNCRSYSNGCRTFNDYANNADTYFTSDSSFYFMKGTHRLNATLFISNVVNLSFVGNESDIILSDGCSIIWNRTSKISWTSFNLMFNETNQISNKSALCIENSQIVTLSNASFSKFRLHSFSRAVLAMKSSIELKNCKFEYGNHSEGGSLCIKDSNITMLGLSVFVGNTGNIGGTVFSSDSQIRFDGNGTFVGNEVG